jgi:hypothetical protein
MTEDRQYEFDGLTDNTGAKWKKTVDGNWAPSTVIYKDAKDFRQVVALNDKIACKPFPSMSVEKDFKGGMVVPKQKGTIQKLEVVFPSSNLAPSAIWVRAEQFTLQWAKDIFDLDGVKFILVPKDQILLIQQS